mmetsp:Transcript_11455/g.36202  ORF Transcript_11455/g.36202 Transcript_11455/m.36202 type:complete len:187 (-) Transcript_11455:176-736(-)
MTTTIMASLLGVLMYMLICLTDLENDFINPHDSAKRINKFVVPEYVAQALLTVIMIGSGHWLFTLVNLGVAAYHVHKVFVRKDFLVDVTEIFNQLPVQKKERLIKLGAYLVCFVYIIYRLVEAAVRGLMSSPATAAVTKKVGARTLPRKLSGPPPRLPPSPINPARGRALRRRGAPLRRGARDLKP